MVGTDILCVSLKCDSKYDMKFKNKNKTYLCPEGMFKIDNNHNIVEGIYKGKHYKDVVAICDHLRVVHEISPNMAILEVIKWKK